MKALLIPSAVLVARDMRSKFGELPTGLFPLAGKTMLEHLAYKYHDRVDKIYVVTYRKRLLIKDYVQSKNLPIMVIELDRLMDLGHTVKYGIQHILADEPRTDFIYLNYADSLLEDELPLEWKDFAYYSNNTTPDEWTYFRAQDGNLLDILDKNQIDGDLTRTDGYQDVFVGVFGIARPRELVEMIQPQVPQEEKTDSFYQALKEYSKNNRLALYPTDQWFDVGHSENYLKAKTNVTARVFNTIEIDQERGILKKKSENKEKLVDEIRWYLRMPSKLQYLLPRIYDYSLELQNPYVSMEYYGYQTLHESLLYGDYPLVRWQNIFKKILFALDDMEKYEVHGEKESLVASLREMYLEKTVHRLDSMRKQKHFASFFTQPFEINGKLYHALDDYLALLPELVDRILLDTFSGSFSIIHGDLCFANILMEDSYNFIRLIDPRGRFGEFDIYGDARYELAKLLHTLEGKYDFIIEDMFSLTVNGNSIEYHLEKNINQIYTLFLSVFREKLSHLQEIRLIEALLFLSMIPLHSDYENRQYAMLATGICLLEQVIEEEKG